MVKVNYFYAGFIGQMQTKEFPTREIAEQFLSENKMEINLVTVHIPKIEPK